VSTFVAMVILIYAEYTGSACFSIVATRLSRLLKLYPFFQPNNKKKAKQEKKCKSQMNTVDVTTMLQAQDCSKGNEHTHDGQKAAEQHVHQSS
jgi:hypothetical protein